MDITLTAADLSLIQQWKQEELARGVSTKGASAPLYESIRDLLKTKLDLNTGAANYAAVSKVYDWLLGGAQVNDAVGPFGTFIREYARYQYFLRNGSYPSEATMNETSNRVAQLVAQNFLDKNGLIPTVGEIGTKDLDGVRLTLFPNDSELANNQAWPGMLLLSSMGEDFTWLVDTESGSQPGTVDSLLDIKNALYAVASVKAAIPLAKNQSLTDLTRTIPIMVSQLGFALKVGFDASGNGLDFTKALIYATTQGKDSEAQRLLRMVADWGPEQFLDALRRETNGGNLPGVKTTESNFSSNAKAWFDLSARVGRTRLQSAV